MIPRPVSAPPSDRPARVIDVASDRYKWYELHRASLLNDGRLLLWESGRSMDDPGDWSISLLDVISGAIAAQGRLVAIGGRSEGLTLDGKPDPAQPNFVSLWDAIAGERLANLAFPPGDFSVRALLFSADARRLYAFVASPSHTQLYVWYLAPEWSALGTK
jgi:hypothetical protein